MDWWDSLVPTKGRVLLRVIQAEEKTGESGIVLPEEKRPKLIETVVVRVCPQDDLIPVGSHAWIPAKYTGESRAQYLLARESEIEAISVS